MAILGAFIVPHPPIIVPDVGRGEEKKIQRTIDACREVARRIAALKPETIVLTSPHVVMYADYFHISPGKEASGDLSRFRARGSGIKAAYDSQFVEALSLAATERGISAGTLGEEEKALDHGTLIPLLSVNEEYQKYKLVRIGLSGLPELDHYRLGKCIAETADKLNRQVVLIASGDLSHKLEADGPYGFASEGPEFDREITKAMAAGDFLRFLTFSPAFVEAAGECGLRSFVIMAGALDGKAVEPEFLSYEGPFGVGYAVCAYAVTGTDPNRHYDEIYQGQEHKRLTGIREKEDMYVRLARYSLEAYLKTGNKPELPRDLPAQMTQTEAGVFVSIKKHGRLRGCIGTIAPVTPSVAMEILNNAISAGAEDPRFDPVTEDELKDLVYSVDILSLAEPISSAADLDVARYGVIVTNGHKRGLLLPNLEGVDSVEEQISIARRKAGIRPEESCTMERFEVVRHT